MIMDTEKSMQWFVMPPGVTDSMALPARYWYTLAEVQCFRSFNVVHHGNWFAPVRWRLGIRKQHQNGVVSPFLQLCQKLTIQVVKRDRTDHRCWTLCWKSGAWAKVQHWNWHKPNGKNMEDSGVCVRTIIWQPSATATFRSWTTLVVGIRTPFMIHLTFWWGEWKNIADFVNGFKMTTNLQSSNSKIHTLVQGVIVSNLCHTFALDLPPVTVASEGL